MLLAAPLRQHPNLKVQPVSVNISVTGWVTPQDQIVLSEDTLLLVFILSLNFCLCIQINTLQSIHTINTQYIVFKGCMCWHQNTYFKPFKSIFPRNLTGFLNGDATFKHSRLREANVWVGVSIWKTQGKKQKSCPLLVHQTTTFAWKINWLMFCALSCPFYQR